MPTCYCPEELGGNSYFEPISVPLSDWSPTMDHVELKSQGGTRQIETSRLAHRLCNRVDYSVKVGRSLERDLVRAEADRAAPAAGQLEHRRGRRDVARMLCDPNLAPVRLFVEEIQRWEGIIAEPYFDRGNGPTGIRLSRDGRRFLNVFPLESLQFAHGSAPLMGLGLASEATVERDYQSIPVAGLPTRQDEARLLAAYAYWRAGAPSHG